MYVNVYVYVHVYVHVYVYVFHHVERESAGHCRGGAGRYSGVPKLAIHYRWGGTGPRGPPHSLVSPTTREPAMVSPWGK